MAAHKPPPRKKSTKPKKVTTAVAPALAAAPVGDATIVAIADQPVAASSSGTGAKIGFLLLLVALIAAIVFVTVRKRAAATTGARTCADNADETACAKVAECSWTGTACAAKACSAYTAQAPCEEAKGAACKWDANACVARGIEAPVVPVAGVEAPVVPVEAPVVPDMMLAAGGGVFLMICLAGAGVYFYYNRNSNRVKTRSELMQELSKLDNLVYLTPEETARHTLLHHLLLPPGLNPLRLQRPHTSAKPQKPSPPPPGATATIPKPPPVPPRTVVDARPPTKNAAGKNAPALHPRTTASKLAAVEIGKLKRGTKSAVTTVLSAIPKAAPHVTLMEELKQRAVVKG